MSLRNQPYLPLYIQDFLTDEKLIECSPESTGVYIRIMCIMHKSDEYGKILLKQKDKQTSKPSENFALKLARSMPWDKSIIEKAIDELVSEGVLIIDGDYLLQKRMVKDDTISEIRAKAGQKGGIKSKLAQAKPQAKPQANAEDEYEYENEDESDVLDKDALSNGDTWRTSFKVYFEEAEKEFRCAIEDLAWLKTRESYHPNLDILKTVEKMFTDFWGTEKGWKNKNKSKTKTIDWRSTINNGLSLKTNQVYKNSGSGRSFGPQVPDQERLSIQAEKFLNSNNNQTQLQIGGL